MTYIDDVASAVRARVPPELMPDGDLDSLFRIYAVLVLAKRQAVQLEDVHDGWSAWMSAQDPAHPSLRPFAELSAQVRDGDRPYLKALRATAAALGPRP